MLTTILFDLDNTLLQNDMQDFVPRYFALIGSYADKYLPRNEFLQALMQATDHMVQNVDPQRTNREVFWQEFGRLSGLDTTVLEADFDRFYQHEFEALRDVTAPQPGAAPLVDWCRRQGLDIVVATNPMFPRRAIEARLSWAGLPASQQDFALVTTMENMHATKPNEVYYQEILDRTGHAPAQALMVGDDWLRDIVPAANVGLHTYWVQPDEIEPSDNEVQAGGQGTLEALLARLQAGWLGAANAA